MSRASTPQRCELEQKAAWVFVWVGKFWCAKLKPAKKYRLNPGNAGIYQDGKIHSIDYPDYARFIRVTGTNLDNITRIRIDLKSGEVHQMTPQQAT